MRPGGLMPVAYRGSGGGACGTFDARILSLAISSSVIVASS
jgi:hypothetical protein